MFTRHPAHSEQPRQPHFTGFTSLDWAIEISDMTVALSPVVHAWVDSDTESDLEPVSPAEVIFSEISLDKYPTEGFHPQLSWKK